MKKNFLLLASCSLVIFISCKKDGTPASNDALSGNWKFVSMTANTNESQQYSDAGINYMDVSTSDYTTSDNGGSVSFSGGMAASKGITYSVSTTVYGKSYEDGVLVDTFSAPFTWTIQPASSTSAYKIIGTDSVFFPGGGLISSGSLSGGNPQQTAASRYKFDIVGDSLLTMTSFYSNDTTQDLGGLTAQVNESVNFSVLLKRQ